MKRGASICAAVATLISLTLTLPSLARDIRNGSTVHVKANSIWFQDRTQIDEWQRLRNSGDATALQIYEKEKLGNRDAWQFINAMMLTPGRMKDSTWIVDTDALDMKRP